MLFYHLFYRGDLLARIGIKAETLIRYSYWLIFFKDSKKLDNLSFIILC
tara:strand:- start:21635 stop:21781 length:147 start_codon:yes stop_codon:yes gene_type:complete